MMTTLLMTVFGSSPALGQGSFKLVQDDNSTLNFTPGADDNTSVSNLTFTIGGTGSNWSSKSRTYSRSDGSETIDYARSAKASNKVSLSSNVPTDGTFIIFKPTRNGIISVDLYWDTTNKHVDAYESSDPTTAIATKNVGSTKEAQTFTFNVESGKTYYVYPSGGTSGFEIFGFKFAAESEQNALMISVEDMRYEAGYTGNSLARTITDFSFTYNDAVISYDSNNDYYIIAHDNGTITITSNSTAKITQVALYCTEPTSTTNRGDFKFETTSAPAGYFYYKNESGVQSVTFTNGSNDGDVSIYSIWISTDIGMGNAKQNVTWSFSPEMGSAIVNQTDYSISGALTTTPTAFRATEYSISEDSGTGTTFNQYHAYTHKVGVNTGANNGVATIQASFAGNNFFNAATPAEYKLIVTGEGKTSWDFTVSEEIDLQNLTADNTNWTYDTTYKYYDSNGHDPSNSALTANNVPLLYTDGLSFNGNIQIFPDNCIRLTNADRTIKIPSVASGKYVAVTFRSTNNSESRGFTASGTSGATGSYNTIAQKTVYIPTNATGDLILTSNNGIEILKIAIVDEIPHESMFTMTTPASTTGVSTSTDIVLTADRAVEVVSGSSTVNLTVNGTTVPFTFNQANNTLTCTNAELVSAGITLANETSYTIALPVDVIHVNGGAMNSAQNFAFVTAAQETGLTPEYNRTWTFDEFETSTIKSTIIENNMELVGTSSKDMSINGSTKTYNDVTYTSRLQFKGAGDSEGRYIHFKVVAGSKVSVWGVSSNSSESRTINISTGATFSSTPVKSESIGSTMGVLEYTSTEAADIYIYANGGFNIYGVKVESNLPGLTRFSPKGNQYTTLNKVGRTQWPEYYVLYAPTEANIQAGELTITSSDPTVLDVSSVTYNLTTSGQIGINGMKMGEGGTATITLQFNGNSSYTPTSTDFTLTVDAAGQFRVQVADQQIQRGQRTVVTPVITDKNGHQLGIRDNGNGNYSTFILSEDDDTPDYTKYFDFTYSVGEGTGTNYNYINIDGSGNVTTKTGENYADVGDTRIVNVTGTIKSGYESLFANSSISGSGTMTIVEAAQQLELDFYFDAARTARKIVAGTDNRVSGSTGIFGDSGTFPDGFPNGRMIYAKPLNEGDEIWFSYAVNADAATLTSEHKIDKKKHIFQYRRGIPIYIDETLHDGDYVSVNAVAMYKNASGEWQLRGGIAKMKFLMVDHSRPAQPTYDPVSPDADSSKNNDKRKIMDTSENVVAYGEGASKTTTGNGNLVFGKFSTSSVYTTYQLINEATVTSGINSVPVVSTEVNKRRFTAVQIRTDAVGEEYISTQTSTEYYYLYDTRLTLTPAGNQYINVNTSTTAPETKVVWYNKALPGWQDVNTKTVTFSIVNRNTDGSGTTSATINETTGVVTAGDRTGWLRIKASYAGGEDHGGSDADGEPQYKSQTAPSDAYFYVYISDPSKEEPVITPASRNFTSSQAYKIQAPINWDVRYTTDGTYPTATNGTYLKKNTSVEAVAINTVTVKAIAYNPDNTTQVSRIVSETYTKVDPLPDPIFDPNGVPSPYYYNTNTLTVQIACAYAGSVIYYTVDGSTPEIGAEGTYKYSGLEKVTISGNVGIKAIAYDPVNDIFSHVVTSNYIYSTEMAKPYFQISNDGGTTWQGLNDSGALVNDGTYWNNGQSQAITPTTQIRIIDPNTIAGTIYFTLNGDVPSADDPNVLIFHNNPFTLAKTTTGKAITILDEASSQVASAEFVIDLGTYSLWEAVEETTPGGKLMVSDGLVISTNKDLKVSNSAGGKVNLNSIDKGNGGNATYMFARPDITATFGGFDNQDWTYMTLADDAIGSPIDNVGAYTIKNNVNNSKDELNQNYNHVYSYKKDPTTANGTGNEITLHEKTFKLPTKGAYVQFEPEKDGDLTIWVLQQGALLYEEDKWFVPNVLRLRPVYLIDEQGNSIQVKKVNGVDQMWSSAHLSSNWTKIQETAAKNTWKDSRYDATKKDMDTSDAYCQWIRRSDGVIFQTEPGDYSDATYKKIANKGPNATETAAIYNMYNTHLVNNGIGIGDLLKPFAIHTGTSISLNGGSFIEDSNDGTGYVLPTGGYAKYVFPVKAGKTYYFTAQATKIGIRGFQFVPTEKTEARTNVEYDATSTTSIITSENMGKPVDVTLKRAFKADTWAAIVLPFSVSTTQLEKVFGAGTSVIHFNKIVSPSTLLFMKHKHQMIVAGTPVIIKPKITVDATTGVKFEGVQIEANSVDVMQDNLYKLVGTFVQTETNKGLKNKDYFFSTSGKFTRWTGNDTAMKGSLAWIQPQNYSNAPALSIGMFSGDDDETTALFDIEIEDLTTGEVYYSKGVYDLNGRKVSEGSLSGLPKGVYIVNGKKVVVD